MLKRLANKLSEYPVAYTFLRKIIEANFTSQRKVISKELSNSGLILDIPCGIGEFSVFFDKDRYVGVDLNEEYVRYGVKKYKKNLMVGDATQLVFDDESFDSVLISGFLHHLNNEEVVKVLDESYRVLKKDGKLLLIEDAPGRSFISKYLQRYDVGTNIRSIDYYHKILSEKFKIEKVYPLSSGLWFYSVFVLRK